MTYLIAGILLLFAGLALTIAGAKTDDTANLLIGPAAIIAGIFAIAIWATA